jgi:hypothetical protein
MLDLPPPLGRPRRRTGHPLGHDKLDMPVTRHDGPIRRRRWLDALRQSLGLHRRTGAV